MFHLRQQLGKKLKDKRKALKLTQENVASAIKVDRSIVSKIESGAYTGSIKKLEAYAYQLNMVLTVIDRPDDTPTWDRLDEIFGED